ncbi:MAG TPA: phosphosulfolactate synthase [Acidimicrobiales bacterium]|jgi:phosphosulfolactate synthase
MNDTTLCLPGRAAKPRSSGITMMVDTGLPLGYFGDLVESGGEYLDFVKFGWGTAVVANDLEAKLEVLRAAGIDFYFGGTLFEKYLHQDRFDEYRQLLHRNECRYVEVSNGTIDLSNTEKAGYVRKLAAEFLVISEVGFKDPGRSENMPPSRWIECIHEDLEAGSRLVTLESRESGRSGICRPDGELRYGLVEELLSCDVPIDTLLFEAPTTSLQAYFVRRVGPDVNLGNVPATGLLGLETLRLGLRGDTLVCFDPGAVR